jgi:signal transduction histidine kinase
MRLRFHHGALAVATAVLLFAGGASAAALKNTPTTTVYYALRDDDGNSLPDALNQTVTLRGVLTLRPFRTNGVWFTYFQDDTGALRLVDRSGRRLGSVTSDTPNFNEGDEIFVRGMLKHSDVDELQVEEVQMVQDGEAPRPRDVWASELHNNHFASQLIRVTGEVGQTNRGLELSFFVRDVTGETRLVLRPELTGDKGELGDRLWKGGKAEVVGIAYRDTNAPAAAGLSLLVRKSSDVEFLPEPPPPPSRVPFYSAFVAAAVLGVLAFYFWEKRRIAEQRTREVSKLLHELKRSQAEIKKQASFAQLNPNPVLELFADGTLTYWNEAAQEMSKTLGCESVRDILPNGIPALVTKCLAAPNARQASEVKLNGRTISWAFFPIPEITSVHAYAQDITDQLSLEAQLRQAQKIESVGQLAAGVAHDFNNMLAVIQGYTSLTLMRSDLPAKAMEPLNEILSAAERASNLTRQLLTFSRKQVIEPRTLDMNDVVANLNKMLRRLIGEDVRLKFTRGETQALVHADPGMLEQVVMNLAINARDAMPDGGELSLCVENISLTEAEATQRFEARAGDFVRVTVADNGCGMDEATMKRIFEPFFTTKEPGKGTGLGLATVHGIVKQHAGWVEVSSQPDKGATFRIYFPGATDAVAVADDKVIRLPVAGGTETILVVEDDPSVRKLARGVLEEYGYGVYDAASAADAIAIWRQHGTDIRLLFTDIVLPDGMSGWTLAETLRRENDQLKVIYSTGFDSETLGRRLDLQSEHLLLRKPYPIQALVSAVRSCLDNVPAVQALGTSEIS